MVVYLNTRPCRHIIFVEWVLTKCDQGLFESTDSNVLEVTP